MGYAMKYDVKEAYKKRNRQYWLAGISLAALSALLFIIAVSKGAMEIPFFKTCRIILENCLPSLFPDAVRNNQTAVVWDIRLPRAVCGYLTGMGLSMAGCIFQSLLKNPLADPYTIGVSTGAAFGACLSILLGLLFGISLPQTAMAFLGAFLTLLAVLLIARRGGGLQSANLVVAGMILSSVLSSGISFMKMAAGENVGAIVFWLMGSLSAVSWTDAALLFPMILFCGILSVVFSARLNLMALGDMTAESLGVNLKQTRLLYLLLASVITTACVAVSGVIGFVGLIVPHILRYALSADNRVLLPLSALLGGFLLLLADNVTRLLFISEIPVGVFTTLLGGPFFILIFMKKQRGRQTI